MSLYNFSVSDEAYKPKNCILYTTNIKQILNVKIHFICNTCYLLICSRYFLYYNPTIDCYMYSLPPCYFTQSALPIYQTGCCPVYYTCDLFRLTDFPRCRTLHSCDTPLL